MSRRVYSNTGCLTCLKRHKKCGEERPYCAACRRLGFACTWASRGRKAASTVSLLKGARATGAKAFAQGGLFHIRPSANCSAMQFCLFATTSLGRLISPRGTSDAFDYSHILTVGLESLWVRDALIAFAAFVFPRHVADLKRVAYEYYDAASMAMRARLLRAACIKESEQLLVATLFLALIEVNNPENIVLPLPHFEAVDFLLNVLIQRGHSVKSSSTELFYRMCSELYLYHVTTCSFFHPVSGRYSEISPLIAAALCADRLSVQNNIIITIDADIYRILFGLTRLGNTNPASSNFGVRLDALTEMLASLTARISSHRQGTLPPSWIARRWFLSEVALDGLLIYFAEVRHQDVLVSGPNIDGQVKMVAKKLGSCVIDRAWAGDLVWILAILQRTARSVGDFDSIRLQVERLRANVWGVDLSRIDRIYQLTIRGLDKSHKY